MKPAESVTAGQKKGWKKRMNKIPITKPFLGEEEEKAVCDVLRSGWLVQGEKVRRFEQLVAEHENVKYACATTSCTTALQLAMLAEGMGAGMDVIAPSFTFVATANSIVSTGATPILFDVCDDTYNIDAKALDGYISSNYSSQDGGLKNKNTGNELWGIVPVHQFGLCADMAEINRVAKKYGLKVVEDGACALGSRIGEKHIGGFGHTVCVSFHPRKSITTGEGGMLLTNDEEVYNRAVMLRNHGSMVASDKRHEGNGSLLPSYISNGYNFRMTDIQAAIGCEQMNRLEYILNRRQEIAAYYDELISEKCRCIKPPKVPDGYFHSYQSYVCMLTYGNDLAQAGRKRNEIMAKLESRGIATRQGTHAVHKLDYYKNQYGYADESCMNANRCDLLSVSLPVFVTITKAEQEYVIENLKELSEE